MFAKSAYCLLGLGLTLFISCMNQSSDGQSKSPAPAIKKENPMDKTEKIDTAAIKKLSPEQAAAKFGKPIKSEDFNLSSPLSEFRIEIYNHIPEKDRYSPEVKIREYTWVYNKEENITVWYQRKQDKWQFLHFNTWPKDAEF
nr:hypothetical protein [Pedobacter sp. ASV19]